MKTIAIFLIHLYQKIVSPWLGNRCRFYPSCSHYTQQAVARFGLLKGGWYGLCRILKCHPWHVGGFDPIPGERAL